MVEHNLAKVGVASSNLVSRSSFCLLVQGLKGAGTFNFRANFRASAAEWQSGYAAACKAVDLGSIPGSASILILVFLIDESRLMPGWRNW